MATENLPLNQIPDSKLKQYRFGQDKANIPYESAVLGSDLGYLENVGLAPTQETYLPKQLIRLVEEEKIEFNSLPTELQAKSQELYKIENELLDKSGLPKAPDAEDYFTPGYALRDQSNQLQTITEQETINTYTAGKAADVVIIQTKFKSPKDIEAAIQKTNQILTNVQAEIALLYEDPLVKYFHILVAKNGNPPILTPEAKAKIQKLAILDLHYRNVRYIARAFYMYQAMTLGNKYPTSIQPEHLNQWTEKDSGEKNNYRQQAEVVSAALYGELPRELWQSTFYKWLEARRCDKTNSMIDQLEERFLSQLSPESRLLLTAEIDVMKKGKEYDRQEATKERVVRFAQAVQTTHPPEGWDTPNNRLQLFEKYQNLAKEAIDVAGKPEELSSGTLQKIIDGYLQANLEKCSDLEAVANLCSFTVSELIPFFEAINSNKHITEQFLNEVGSLKAQNLVDILSVNADDLKEIFADTTIVDKLSNLSTAKYSRRNVVDFANLITQSLTAKNLPYQIDIGKRIDNENKDIFHFVITKSGMVSLNTTGRMLKVPVTRLFTVLSEATLKGHEYDGHYGGFIRVEKYAAGLINTFSSNGPNEGLAVTSGQVESYLIDREEIENLDLTNEGKGGFEDIYRQYQTQKYRLDNPKELNIPATEGLQHIIALGLHLGYGSSSTKINPVDVSERPSRQEIFDIMNNVFTIEYAYNGEVESMIPKKAAEFAFKDGVMRQCRGLWDGHITLKNMSYSTGGLIIKSMIENNQNLSQLVYGKVGPQHQVYRNIFGVKPKDLDQRWVKINRQELLHQLGIQ